MSRPRSLIGRLVRRLTGASQLERLAVVDEKVGAFGRAQRKTLTSHGRQLDELRTAIATRASGAVVKDVVRRLERIERLVEHQDRLYSDALERSRLLDEQAVGDRRLARRLEAILRRDRAIVVGPWTGEVGFELIYWLPFVRWVAETYRIPPERLLVVSRGGTAGWYGGMAGRYADAFDFVVPEQFRAATAAQRKQRRVGAFDAELVRRVIERHQLGRPELLHPGLMYRLFMPFWKDAASIARVSRYSRDARIVPEYDAVLQGLPAEYAAVRFYFNDCFPDTPANREFVMSTVDGLARHLPVVLLNTQLNVDDHRDWDARGSRVITVAGHMTAARNLAVQTAVIARARAFVGTYGGYSYLAPLCGVPSLAFYSTQAFKLHHLHVAQHLCARLGGPTVIPIDVAAVPLAGLTLAGLALAADARAGGRHPA